MKRAWQPFSRMRASLRTNSFVLLVRHFFHRFFAGEAFSGEDDLRVGIGGIVALLALPGAILPLLLLPKYSSFLRWLTGVRHFDYNTASIPDKYTFVTLTMVVMGIVAALKWDSMFPDVLDRANLSPLPISTRRIFAAKFIALLLFAALFIFSLNGTSTLFFPFVVMGNQTRTVLWMRFVAAHAAATVAGSAFMFFSFVALAGLLMTVLPYRRFRQISTIVRFAAVIVLVMLLFFTPKIGALVRNAGGNGYTFVRWLPTVWFLGLYQALSSAHAGANFDALAIRGMLGLSVAAGASLLFYIASYKRFFLHVSEVAEAATDGQGKLSQFRENCLNAFAPRRAYERACFCFAAKTLARSQRHALVLAGFAGLGVAVAIQDVSSKWDGVRAVAHAPAATLLSAPAAIMFFVLTGFIFVFSVPAELRANWVFRTTGERKCDAARHVARRLMLIFLAPSVALVTVIYSASWGARLGVEHAAFLFVTSWMLIEVSLMGFRKIPFTCSYSSAKHNVGIVLALYFLAFLFFSPGLASVEHLALSSRSLVPFLILLAIFAGVTIGICWYGRETEIRKGPLLFADEREPIVPSMELR